MAERPSYNQRDNRRGQNNRSRGNLERRRDRDDRDDFDEIQHRQRPIPRNNGQLLLTFDKGDYPELGMTSEEMRVEEKRVVFAIDRSDEPVRLNERSPGEYLKTVRDLAEQDLEREKTDHGASIRGELAPQLGTALIIRDRVGKERVVTFARPELESFGRKKSGPTGLLNDMPGRQAIEEIGQEHLIFGTTKVGMEKIIMAVDNGDLHDIQARTIGRAKQRIAQVRRKKLEALIARPGENVAVLREAAHEAAEMMKPHRIVFVKKKRLAQSLEEAMTTVHTEVGEKSESIKGIVHYGLAELRPTIVAPVCIEPESSGIDMDSLTFLDATGEEREVELIEDADATQADHIREIARNLGRPKLVQRKPGGPVLLPPPREIELAHDPTAVLPANLPKAA